MSAANSARAWESGVSAGAAGSSPASRRGARTDSAACQYGLWAGCPDSGYGPRTWRVEIPASGLPRLITGAYQQLQGFLHLLESRALPLAGPIAGSLAPALATQFHVSWPAPALTARS
jgi:hypothetical protein